MRAIIQKDDTERNISGRDVPEREREEEYDLLNAAPTYSLPFGYGV